MNLTELKKMSKSDSKLLLGLYLNLNFWKSCRCEPLKIVTTRLSKSYDVVLSTSLGSINIKSGTSLDINLQLLIGLTKTYSSIKFTSETYVNLK